MNIHRVIVPVVCGPEMTRKCVDSALAQDVDDIEVLVVGNGCIDNTMQMVSARYWNDRRVRIVAHASMKSLNYVWNDAIEAAFVEGLAYVLVVNNDIIMRSDTFKLLRDDGGLFVTGVSVGRMEEIASAAPESRSPHPCFSCFLVRRECWDLVGGFDEAFWAYASDADYHLRMDRAGVDAYALNVPFYHETSSTLKKVDDATRDMLMARADGDRAYFKKKYGFEVGSDEYYAAFSKQRDNKYKREGVL